MVLGVAEFEWMLCLLVLWRELVVVLVAVVVAMATTGGVRENSTQEGTEKLVTYVM